MNNGDGIVIYASDHNAVKENVVNGNNRYGIALKSITATICSSKNLIKENVALDNGEFDLYWDGLGESNIWKENLYETKNW